jgi:hypothetical protein
MSDMSSNEVREAQFTFVSSYVRRLDPSATDAAITRYLAEIETMALALQSLDVPAATHIEAFTTGWPDGDRA